MRSRPDSFLGRLRNERGVALVEFALVSPLLFLLVFGVLDFGRAFNYWIDQTHLAAEGARLAEVDSAQTAPCSDGTSSLQCYIQSRADTPQLTSGATVCVSFPTNPATGTQKQVDDPVEVTVKSTYAWLPLLGDFLGGPITLTGKATMRLEALPSNYAEGSGGTGTCP